MIPRDFQARLGGAAIARATLGGNSVKKGSSATKSAAIKMNRPELPNRSNTEAVENMKAASTPI